MESPGKKTWFAMSATYKRELKVKQILDGLNIQNFIPMGFPDDSKNAKNKNGKKTQGKNINKREKEPLIHNLIFVYDEFKLIKEIKNSYPYLQFLTNCVDGKKKPIEIRDKEMQNFINIINSQDEGLELKPIDNTILNIKKGTKVRIKGGPLDNQEGYFVKIEGRRKRCFIVNLINFAQLQLKSISASMVEVIK